MASNLTPRQQHDIRNGIQSYKSLRKRMFKAMLAQVAVINEMDVQIKRIETAAFNGNLPPIKPWYKRMSDGIRRKIT